MVVAVAGTPFNRENRAVRPRIGAEDTLRFFVRDSAFLSSVSCKL